MNEILLITADSIRALLHQRLLLALMLCSLVLTTWFSITMATARRNINQSFEESQEWNSVTVNGTNQMSDADRQKLRAQMEAAGSMLQGAFYGIVSFGGSIVTLMIFSTAVAAEIRKGTIRLTLSKPVSRGEFLLGKYLGGVTVLAGYTVVASLGLLIFAETQGVSLNPAIKWAPWLLFCRLLMLGSATMLLSLYVHPAVAAVLAYFAGNGLYPIYIPLYWVLPSYSAFNVFSQVLEGTLIHSKDVLFLSLYAADFVAIMLLLALWRFRTKELV
jgi:ABC-type transport system involved in multi-copper enzyme maturation permease subunit